MKRILSFTYIVLSLLLLLYLAYPVDLSIDEFTPLPNSVKSSLSGDTVQVPDVSAYFSNNYRSLAIPFYYSQFTELNKLPLPPLRLNYPPEFAFEAIKDQTQSTYLEEFVYPMRNSLFVNGLEPFDQETHEKRYLAARDLVADDGNAYETKVTLRYRESTLTHRLITWFGINLGTILLYMVFRRAQVHV